MSNISAATIMKTEKIVSKVDLVPNFSIVSSEIKSGHINDNVSEKPNISFPPVDVVAQDKFIDSAIPYADKDTVSIHLDVPKTRRS